MIVNVDIRGRGCDADGTGNQCDRLGAGIRGDSVRLSLNSTIETEMRAWERFSTL